MTNRQKKRAKIIGENGTTKAELLAAGYALSTATKQPPTVMKAKGWLEILNEKLPDEKLLTKHDEALEANKIHGTENNFIEIPDHQTRLKAVELGYKLKGKLTPETALQLNVGGDMTVKFTKRDA